MARTFRVGIVGGEDFMFGVETFDLTAEQICTVLENADPMKSVASTNPGLPAPVMKYQVMSGGRFFPTVSREELSEAIQGVEIMIARLNSNFSLYSFSMSVEFFQAMFTENLADKCKIIIARIVDSRDSVKTASRQRRASIKPKDLIKRYGLDLAQTNNIKTFIITDSSKSKPQKKNAKASPWRENNIEAVRTELTGQEIKMAIMQPIKETVTAGKAIIGLGSRISNWFSSLTKSH